MAKTDNDGRKNNIIRKREDVGNGFSVRLHFAQDGRENHVIEEIQELLMETYIRSLRRSED